MKIVYIILVTFVIISNLVDSCYITNCPWGGKRSYSDEISARQCKKCANGLGTCFGPRLCCGQDIGCLLDTKETLACREEDIESSSPCSPYGKSCSKIEFGKCATNHLCCSPDRCVPDSNCSSDDSLEELNELKTQKEKLLEKKILDAIKYLLKEKKQSNDSDK